MVWRIEVGAAAQRDRFAGSWKYRVGDFRVIAQLDDGVMVVLAVSSEHRRDVYC